MPSPTHTPAHTVAFGGECANVLSLDQVASLLAGSSELSARTARPSPGVGALGGIRCRWDLEDQSSVDSAPTSLEISVFADADVANAIADEIADPRCDPWYDSTVCRLGRAVDGAWIMASTSSLPTEPDSALLDAAITAVSANLGRYAAPVRMPAEENWWAITTCEDLGERMGLRDLLGEGYVTGWWEANPGEQIEFRLTAAQGVEQICEWFPDYDGPGGANATAGTITLTLWPGGAWDSETLLAGGSPLSVSGAQRSVADLEYPDRVRATDGVNAVEVYAVNADGADVTARFFAAQNR